MIKVELDKVTIGYDKNCTAYNIMQPIASLLNIPKEEFEKMNMRANVYADLCFLLDALADEFGKDKAMQIWTLTAEQITSDWKTKENKDNE